MRRYLTKRLGMMLVTLLLITLLTFILMHVVPGGPFTNDKQIPESVLSALRKKYKLDEPLAVQYLRYLGGLARFDFGPSLKYTGKSVNDFIQSGFPFSARLGALTLVFVLLASIPMGVVSALRSGRWQDALLMGAATLGVTIPSFVIATGLLYIFAFRLGWLPTFGVAKWQGYVLPVAALGGYSISFLARLTRSSLLEVMGQDYIRTARAKGLRETRVIIRHALPNALIPVVTVLGPTVANLLTGSFVIEKIFAIPGMGAHFVNSITQRDYTTIMGTTVFYATFLISMVFIVDLFYCLLDPRIRLE
ncbi:MAG: ABC transporter permease [Oscillospiraceae bacterium]|nr:ABC transporter permease [Oscillospiraceae bacterium]